MPYAIRPSPPPAFTPPSSYLLSSHPPTPNPPTPPTPSPSPSLLRLATSLIIIFMSQLTISKVSAYMEIVVNTKLKARKNEAERQARLDEGKDVMDMTEPEKEHQLEDYNPSLSVIGDYATIVMQYGRLSSDTVFSSALLLSFSPALSYVPNPHL
jgi:hypothetical protein